MGNTANLVAHATHDEIYYGWRGDRGCQIGCELQASQWFQRGWICVYRPNDPEIAEKIAVFMEKAISNGFIGYDRAYRDGLYAAVFDTKADSMTVKTEPDEVNTSVSCDCSSLVYCAVYHATGVKYDKSVPNDAGNLLTVPTVRMYGHYIENQCADMFTKLEGDDYTASKKNLVRGDLLVAMDLDNDNGHIAVWI